MSIKLKILPVYQGDSIMLLYNNDKNNIMIDSGTRRSYTKGCIKKELNSVKKVDLLVLTHTDEDHIGGILKYYSDPQRTKNIFKKVWFNSGQIINEALQLEKKENLEVNIEDQDDLNMSIKQGVTLEDHLFKDGILEKKLITAGHKLNLEQAEIQVLSPEIEDLKEIYTQWEIEKDYSLEMSKSTDYDKEVSTLIKNNYIEAGTIANKSSIAFLFSFQKKNLLLMGDGFPSIMEKQIRKLGFNEGNKLKIDVTKLSHHANKHGISPDLLNIIDCNQFIISTNGINGLPSKECLSRIVTHKNEKITLYFNYKNEVTKSIFSDNEIRDNNIEIIYLNVQNDYTITING